MRAVSPYQPKEQYESILASEHEEIAVCEKNGKLVGAVWLVQRTHEGGAAIPISVAFIQEICVASGQRRSGVGRELMKYAEQWARSRGLQSIEFNVWAENETALSFYMKLGYRYVRHELSKSIA